MSIISNTDFHATVRGETDFQLTTHEKASLLAGIDDWHVRGVERLGIPSIRVTDCGHGVTLCGDRCSPATCFPTGIGMASTWNTPLMERVGEVIGRETRALGCSMMLGPMINLHRIPLNGRSFETFSEDPVLAGVLGAAIIRGIQRVGVAACVKAVAANNQQRDQDKIAATVDMRTLRELYLLNFEIAIRDAHPAAVMTAYNGLNGELTSENRWLLTDLIKGQWGFEGLIVSDWRAVKSKRVFSSGLDLEMPGPGKLLNTTSVLKALEDGLLSQVDLDDKARRIVSVLDQYGRAKESEGALDTPEHRALARQVAEESIVLLKNHNDLLPLDRKRLKRVLVTGPNAATARLGGGGSASVTPFYSISPLEGIREICGDDVEVRFIEGCGIVGSMETLIAQVDHLDASGKRTPGWRAEFFNNGIPNGAPDAAWVVPQIDYSWGWAAPGPGVLRCDYAVRFRGRITPTVSGKYRLGLFGQEGCVRLSMNGQVICQAWSDDDNFEGNYVSQYETAEVQWVSGEPVEMVVEYQKRAARGAVRLEWQVPGAIDGMQQAIDAAADADVVIICAGLSNLHEGGSRDRASLDLPATQVRLIEAISKVNPKTVVALFNGGPVTMPWEPQVPALLEAWYPGQEGGRALARILFGDVNPSGRLPDTLAHRLTDHASASHYPGDGREVVYAEGLSVGYRHFDSAKIEPHYPFGYGLSYTRFEIAPTVCSERQLTEGESLNVNVKVKNVGTRDGATVVQAYVRPIAPPVWRPEKELKTFVKVHLSAGESTEVQMRLRWRDFAYFDVDDNDWRVAPGQYDILIGEHSRSLIATRIKVGG